MGGFLGQLQFRLDESCVMSYCGEQCLRNVKTIRVAEDENQTEFVFVQDEEENLYYFVSDDSGSLHHKVQYLQVRGSSFHVVKDDRGFLMVLVVNGRMVYVVRQQRYRPDLFEVPVLVYEGQCEIQDITVISHYGSVYVSLIEGISKSRSLVLGVYKNEFIWERVQEILSNPAIRFVIQGEDVYVDLSDDERRIYPVCLIGHGLENILGLVDIEEMKHVSQYFRCPANKGFYESYGLVDGVGDGRELFCGYAGGVWHVLSGIRDVVMYKSRFYYNKTHVLLVDKLGVVYHVVIDQNGRITQRVIMELGFVKSIDVIVSKKGLIGYAMDRNHDLIYRMSMLCPDENWQIAPSVLYYRKRYEIHFNQKSVVMGDYVVRKPMPMHILPGSDTEVSWYIQETSVCC